MVWCVLLNVIPVVAYFRLRLFTNQKGVQLMSKPKKIKTITINKEELGEIIEQAYRYGVGEGRRSQIEENQDIESIIDDAQAIHGKL